MLGGEAEGLAFRETSVETRGGLETRLRMEAAGEPALGIAVADSEHRIWGFTAGFLRNIGCGEEELRGKEKESLDAAEIPLFLSK